MVGAPPQQTYNRARRTPLAVSHDVETSGAGADVQRGEAVGPARGDGDGGHVGRIATD